MFKIGDFSIVNFIVLVGALIIMTLIYVRYLRPRLFEQLSENSTILLLIERILLIFVSLAVAYGFILLNPLVNGAITLGVMYLSKEIISNIFHGILLIRELNLKEGKSIRIGNRNGLISRLSYTGIQLTNDDNTEFVPFRKAYNNGIKEDSELNATLLTLHGTVNEEADFHNIVERIEAKLFSLPFLIYQKKPSVELNDHEVRIIVGIESYAYKSSLISALEQTGIHINIK